MTKCFLPIATLLTLLAIVVPGCSDDNPLRGVYSSKKPSQVETAGR